MAFILGLDYGTKRMGLAISDETETIAEALEIVNVSNEQDALQKLALIFRTKNVSLIVIGLPLGLEEKPTQISKVVLKFADDLNKITEIPIVTWNETLTSEFAKRNPVVKKKQIDSESARIILQEYLDFQKNRI